MYSVEEISRLFITLRSWILEDLLLKLPAALLYSQSAIQQRSSSLIKALFGLIKIIGQYLRWSRRALRSTMARVAHTLMRAVSLAPRATKLAYKKRVAKKYARLNTPRVSAAKSPKKPHSNSSRIFMGALQFTSTLILISILLNNLGVGLLGIERIANPVMEFIISGRVIGSEYYLKLNHLYGLIGLLSVYYLASWTVGLREFYIAWRQSNNSIEQLYSTESVHINLTIKDSTPTHLYIRTI